MHTALSNVCKTFSQVLASGGYNYTKVGTKPSPRIDFVEIFINNNNNTEKITIELLYNSTSGKYTLYARRHVNTGKVWNLLPSKTLTRVIPEYSTTDDFLTNMMDLFQISLNSL